jgi:ABC-type molybdate transport system permease subunit
MAITVIIGVILVAWRQRRQNDLANPMTWLASIAGLTFLGTAASTFFQLAFCATQVSVGLEVIITLVFAIVPLVIGVLTLRLALRNSQVSSIRKRVYLVILGVAALFSWAGLIVGPILAFAAAFMPTRLKRTQSRQIDNKTAPNSR